MNNAELYRKIHDLYPGRVNAEALSEFGPRLRWDYEAVVDEEEVVLDVGCGDGQTTAKQLLPLLPERVRRLVGADLSPAMVNFAAKTHALPRLRFVQADIATADLRASPLRAETGERGFCKIFSFFCLHWVQDQRTGLSNIYQLLRPSGEAFLLLAATSPVFSTFEDLSKQQKWQPYMTDVSEYISPYQHSHDPGREFSTLLTEVGFQIVDCRWEKKSQVFHDLKLVNDYLVSVNPFADRIPDTDKDQFAMDTLMTFLRQKEVTDVQEENKDPQFKISYSLLIVLVEKRKC